MDLVSFLFGFGLGVILTALGFLLLPDAGARRAGPQRQSERDEWASDDGFDEAPPPMREASGGVPIYRPPIRIPAPVAWPPARTPTTRGLAHSPSREDARQPADSETLCREFLTYCDERLVDQSMALDWFRERGRTAVVLQGGREWSLLRVPTAEGGYVLPAIRKTMGDVPLRDYYEFIEYNGLQPLTASCVVRFCRVNERGSSEKGLIDGSRL